LTVRLSCQREWKNAKSGETVAYATTHRRRGMDCSIRSWVAGGGRGAKLAGLFFACAMSACAADFGDTAQALREAPQDVTESAASDAALVDVPRAARSRMSSSASGIVPAIASPEPRAPNGWARRRRWAKDPVPRSRAEDGVIQHIVVKLVDGAGVRVVGGAIERSSETPSEDDRERMQYLGCSAEAVGAHAERLSTRAAA
jgi:hypothetical protein